MPIGMPVHSSDQYRSAVQYCIPPRSRRPYIFIPEGSAPEALRATVSAFAQPMEVDKFKVIFGGPIIRRALRNQAHIRLARDNRAEPTKALYLSKYIEIKEIRTVMYLYWTEMIEGQRRTQMSP